MEIRCRAAFDSLLRLRVLPAGRPPTLRNALKPASIRLISLLILTKSRSRVLRYAFNPRICDLSVFKLSLLGAPQYGKTALKARFGQERQERINARGATRSLEPQVARCLRPLLLSGLRAAIW